MSNASSVLIIEGRFYNEIADELAKGATTALDAAGIEYDRISVPGALEIPVALSLAIEAGEVGPDCRHQGAIALGCVIRGETAHYDIVANESARGLMSIGISKSLPVGNGILTVDTREQARIRAEAAGKNKGGDAARACLTLMKLRQKFGKVVT